MTVIESGIAGIGAYIPDTWIPASELREGWGQFLARGVSSKAVPAADEDAITMAYEASTRALTAAGIEGGDIDKLLFASTTPPVAEEDLTAKLGAMLAIPETATRAIVTGSTAAGAQCLVEGGRSMGRTLVVASDCPHGDPDDAIEHAAGAGAAAFVLEPEAPIAISDVSEYAIPYPGTRFRNRGSETVDSLDVTSYERESFSRALTGAASQLDYDPSQVAAAAIHAPDAAIPYRATGPLGVDKETVAAATVADEIGDAGTAGVPIALASAIADGADRVLVAGYGSGATAALLLLERSQDRSPPTDLAIGGSRQLSFAEYVRLRGDVTSGAPEGGGGYVSIPTWQRSIAQRYRLEAGRCPECEELNFPPTGVCSSCRASVGYDSVALSRSGTLEALSVIAQGGAPPEFAELQTKYGGAYATGIVSFDGPDGDSVSAPAFVLEADPDDLSVGDRVEATIRRIYTQEGVTRYGFKVAPTDEASVS
ncbi:zinc ribbon domain-containing protein [Halococcus sediminicola]|uniref:zinc ribbon domain-containing protein n=1 Tax=Halococcus sediminicola TaxID=1264579 RepID=UPI000678A5B7|nr:zinc ribbon domain-containing protein [Halococcus sediminicola]